MACCCVVSFTALHDDVCVCVCVCVCVYIYECDV